SHVDKLLELMTQGAHSIVLSTEATPLKETSVEETTTEESLSSVSSIPSVSVPTSTSTSTSTSTTETLTQLKSELSDFYGQVETLFSPLSDVSSVSSLLDVAEM